MKLVAFAFLYCVVASPAQAAPSELTMALQAAKSDVLSKGMSISPLGKIRAGKRSFWIAQAQWAQPPEEIAGTPHGSCSLIVLERQKDRLIYLGRYAGIDCEYPIFVRNNRVVAGVPKWAEPEINTASFTIGEKGPPDRIVFAGWEASFEK